MIDYSPGLDRQGGAPSSTREFWRGGRRREGKGNLKTVALTILLVSLAAVFLADIFFLRADYQNIGRIGSSTGVAEGLAERDGARTASYAHDVTRTVASPQSSKAVSRQTSSAEHRAGTDDDLVFFPIK